MAMFPCACSLRSTQCAALIALAAAAGIMRIEPRNERAGSSSPSGEQVSIKSVDQAARSMSRFHIDGGTIAPWVRLVHVTWQLVDWAPPALSPPIEKILRPRFIETLPLPSARQHSFPYAVGPPPSRITPTPRAGDTEVSGDSIARRGLFSRLAADLFLHRFARTPRTGNPGPKLAGTFSNPSSALRGEPVNFILFSGFAGRIDVGRCRCARVRVPEFPLPT